MKNKLIRIISLFICSTLITSVPTKAAKQSESTEAIKKKDPKEITSNEKSALWANQRNNTLAIKHTKVALEKIGNDLTETNKKITNLGPTQKKQSGLGKMWGAFTKDPLKEALKEKNFLLKSKEIITSLLEKKETEAKETDQLLQEIETVETARLKAIKEKAPKEITDDEKEFLRNKLYRDSSNIKSEFETNKEKLKRIKAKISEIESSQKENSERKKALLKTAKEEELALLEAEKKLVRRCEEKTSENKEISQLFEAIETAEKLTRTKTIEERETAAKEASEKKTAEKKAYWNRVKKAHLIGGGLALAGLVAELGIGYTRYKKTTVNPINFFKFIPKHFAGFANIVAKAAKGDFEALAQLGHYSATVVTILAAVVDAGYWGHKIMTTKTEVPSAS
ncbi:hypothetical protein HOD08_05130 [bacterium]|nr:hypothetical protein [bacterium]